MTEFKGYMNGINLGGWLSQCVHTKEHYDSFITEEDFKIFSTWGLDHIRIPVDYNLVEDDNGNYKEEGFAYIQQAIDWCGKYNLNMVLDLHKTFGYSFDKGEQESGFFENEAYQDRFYKLWDQFAERFGKYEDRMCFELLNEVTSKEYCDIWNQISTKCIERVRKFAPTIDILIGGYYNNSVTAVKDLAAPYDEHIVYNFHCYDPLLFTHQGAYWIDDMAPDFRQKFEDAGIGEDYFEELFGEAIAVADERNVRMYCGEFGVIDLCYPEGALKWYELIFKTFKAHGIGHAAWSYKKMDFGLDEDIRTGVRKLILDFLK